MTRTSPSKSQPDIFHPLLTDFIDTDHQLVVLADRIKWDYFEDAFAGHCSHTGQPAMPICFMVGCLLLKWIYDYGDETLAKAWVILHILAPPSPPACNQSTLQISIPCP